VLHAYVQSRVGRRRWFLHDNANVPIAHQQENLSFIQQRFLLLAHEQYGTSKDDLPPEARKHL